MFNVFATEGTHDRASDPRDSFEVIYLILFDSQRSLANRNDGE